MVNIWCVSWDAVNKHNADSSLFFLNLNGVIFDSWRLPDQVGLMYNHHGVSEHIAALQKMKGDDTHHKIISIGLLNYKS